MPDLSWIRKGALIDEGTHTAVYPYFKLRNILKPEDARTAVIEETQTLEQEFGTSLVAPFYRLVWALNTGKEICTSHTAVSPPGCNPPFEWARHCVGTEIIILPRNQAEQHERRVTEEMVSELGRTLIESPFLAGQNTKGWLVTILPVNINISYETVRLGPDGGVEKGVRDCRGYGCRLVISGSASSRQNACERWSRRVCFTADTLEHLQKTTGAPGPPHKHNV